jgi:hypothetical protein
MVEGTQPPPVVIHSVTSDMPGVIHSPSSRGSRTLDADDLSDGKATSTLRDG